MATSTIVINQTGLPAGVAGQTRDDLVLSAQVQLTNEDNTGVRAWIWELLDRPLGSSAELSNAFAPNPTFVPDAEGTYRIRLTVNGGTRGTQVSTRLAIVRDSNGLRVPGIGESSEANYPISGLLNGQGYGPDLVALLDRARTLTPGSGGVPVADVLHFIARGSVSSATPNPADQADYSFDTTDPENVLPASASWDGTGLTVGPGSYLAVGFIRHDQPPGDVGKAQFHDGTAYLADPQFSQEQNRNTQTSSEEYAWAQFSVTSGTRRITLRNNNGVNGGNYTPAFSKFRVVSLGGTGGSTGPTYLTSQAEAQTLIDAGPVGDEWINVEFESAQIDFAKDGELFGFAHCLLLSGKSRVRISGAQGGTTIRFNGSTLGVDPATAILLDGCDDVLIENIHFVSLTNDDASSTNYFGAVTLRGDTTNVRIRNCTFQQVTPATVISDPDQFGFSFDHNRVYNAPNAVTLGNRCSITDNFFINDSYVATRSHAIYQFGGYGQTLVSGNFFKNISTHCIKWKGNTGVIERKSSLIFTSNTAEDAQAMVEVGSDSEVVHEDIVIASNRSRNCTSGVFGFAMSRATINGNVVTCDRFSRHTVHSGVAITGSGIGSTGATAVSRNVLIENNTIENLSHVAATLRFDAIPTVGDTVTLGSTVYTWTAGVPATATDVQVHVSSIATNAERLTKAMQGARTGVTALDPELAAPDDVRRTAVTAATQRVYIDVPSTGVALSTTGTAVVVEDAFTDYRALLQHGIRLGTCPGPIDVRNNYVRDAEVAMQATNCIRPRIMGNRWHGSTNPTGSTPYWVNHQGCVYTEYDGNNFEVTPATQDTPNRRAQLTDGFILMGHNPGLDGLAAARVPEDLLGRYGEVETGTGTAEMMMFFGNTGIGGTNPESSQSTPLVWHTGDTVELDDGDGNVHTYTYRRLSPGAGEFNSKATLLALINAEATFAGTDYDNWNPGYLKITSTGSAPTITVTTDNVACGVVLTNNFLGGSASADKTVIWTPIAAAVRPCFVQPANAAAVGSSPNAFRVDVVEGAAYVISHSVAPGAEFKFWISG